MYNFVQQAHFPLAQDWKPVFGLYFDLTNTVFVILKIQIGLGETKTVIPKAILISRDAIAHSL